MKKIEATINPFTLDDVRDALTVAGIESMTISEVRGLLQQGQRQMYRGVQYSIDYSPKIKIEMVVSDEQLVAAVEILERAARTDHHGDGKIVVLPVEEAIRIRTGQHGTDAIGHGVVRRSRAA
jgi:nitrogen regulatory protein P-II 1